MRRAKLEIYRDGRGEWRWRLRASNGRIVADSGEGYQRRASALHAMQRVHTMLSGDVPVVEVKK